MLCYIISIKATAKRLSPLNMRLPSQKSMAAGVKSSSKSMLLWIRHILMEWVLLCFFVELYRDISSVNIIYPFYRDIQVLFVHVSSLCWWALETMWHVSTDIIALSVHDDQAPQNMASSKSKMMLVLPAPTQDFVKKVSNRKPESNPNHELTISFHWWCLEGKFFPNSQRVEMPQFSSKHSFWSSNSKWWWRFTVCCSRQVRWAPPLRSLTCARAACCSSFEGLRWDVSCRGYAWGLILGSRYVL